MTRGASLLILELARQRALERRYVIWLVAIPLAWFLVWPLGMTLGQPFALFFSVISFIGALTVFGVMAARLGDTRRRAVRALTLDEGGVRIDFWSGRGGYIPYRRANIAMRTSESEPGKVRVTVYGLNEMFETPDGIGDPGVVESFQRALRERAAMPASPFPNALRGLGSRGRTLEKWLRTGEAFRHVPPPVTTGVYRTSEGRGGVAPPLDILIRVAADEQSAEHLRAFTAYVALLAYPNLAHARLAPIVGDASPPFLTALVHVGQRGGKELVTAAQFDLASRYLSPSTEASLRARLRS